MATRKTRSSAADAATQQKKALEVQLRALCSEDDFAGGLTVLNEYPQLNTRRLSLFEDDLRDWGFVYGLAFGLALSANPEMAHEDAAKLSYRPALDAYTNWGGVIEDPGEKREAAIRALVERFNEVDHHSMMAGDHTLHDTVAAVVESARA